MVSGFKTLHNLGLISHLGIWGRNKSVKLSDLYTNARYVKNVLFPRFRDSIFIFDDGYILYVYDGTLNKIRLH